MKRTRDPWVSWLMWFPTVTSIAVYLAVLIDAIRKG